MAGTLITGNKRAAFAERGNDLYETPDIAVEALLRHELVGMHVWEPACGPGRIVRVLRRHGCDVFATDLVNYETPDQDVDGIDFTSLPIARSALRGSRFCNVKPVTIITNPPYKYAEMFVKNGLELASRVILLLRLAFLESEKRSDILDNGTLARVHVFRKRLPMMHRAGWAGRKSSSAIAFAWFVWNRTHKGPAIISRISWDR